MNASAKTLMPGANAATTADGATRTLGVTSHRDATTTAVSEVIAAIEAMADDVEETEETEETVEIVEVVIGTPLMTAVAGADGMVGRAADATGGKNLPLRLSRRSVKPPRILKILCLS